MDSGSGVVPDSMLLKLLRRFHGVMLAREPGSFNLKF
jgi:hypothetical protein